MRKQFDELKCKLFIPAAILLLLIPGLLLSQQNQEIALLGLSVEGNEQTDGGLIIATSGLVVGETLSGEKIQRAIRRLWELDLFSDIRIVAEQVTPEGAYIQIQVEENPRLDYIDISGGDKIDKDEIEEAIDLLPGQVLRRSDPVRIKRKLSELAAEKGFLLADIKVEMHPSEIEGQSYLYIRINEGKKVKIEDLYFLGNEVFSDGKLRKQLDDTKRRNMWLLTTGEFKRGEYEKDLEELIEFYREHGYRDAQILDDVIWYSEDKKRMFIQIKIEEGNRYYFGDVHFSETELFSEETLKRQLLFSPGEVFNQKKYEVSIQERLGSLYYDQGYIYAEIQANEEPAGGDTLDIRININPGNQFDVRKINITGNTKTREKVIRRELVIKPGDTFNVSKLRRSMREVIILNFFSDVQPDVEDINDKQVDLWIDVEEKPTDQANVSAGYSEQDGVIGAIGFSAPNLFGTGQRLSLDWNFGQQYGSFSISYTEPWLFNTETLVGASLYNVRRRWAEGFSEDLIGGSLKLGRRFRWPDDYFYGNWIYRLERSKYYNFTESFRERNQTTIVEDDPRISSTLTQIITRDSRDFPEFPTSGSVSSLTTEIAGSVLGGEDAYHKHIFSMEWYTSFHPKVVLYNQLLYGFMGSLSDDPTAIPLLEYFYMGGSGLSLGTPLRGYEERTVGPQASSGVSALGGKAQIKFGTEFRVQLVDNPTIYGLAFAEAGDTWLEFENTDPFNLKRSVGLGIRLYMPLVGMIGLDYGFGVDYYDDTGQRRGQWKPHFQFGRQF